jgi:MFS family permease
VKSVFDTAATEPTSTWFALRNHVFLRVWLASVLSATFLSIQDVTATWLMHDLGASFSLSLMATATSTPLFLFALPAGVIADIVNRRTVILSALAWQAICSAILAVGAWTQVISINYVLACVFALGIGIAFTAPVWGAVVPDIVSKDELPSAITLGGVQVNIAGIVGPSLGGFLLPLVGAPLLFSISALTFVIVAFAVLQWRPHQKHLGKFRESFMESFLSSLRYARNSNRIKVILFRNFLFSVVISAIPTLLPVIMFGELKTSAGQLGLAFTCVGAGSLAAAVFVLPYLRERTSPNAITSIAMALIAVVLLAMSFIRTSSLLMVYSILAGVAWTLVGTELWLVAQRSISGAIRGRINAFLIMVGQGGVALGSILLGAGAAQVGLSFILLAAAVLAVVVLGIGFWLSLDFPGKDTVVATPVSPADEAALSQQQDDAEAIGYYINSISRMMEYRKNVQARERIRSNFEKKNKPRP